MLQIETNHWGRPKPPQRCLSPSWCSTTTKGTGTFVVVLACPSGLSRSVTSRPLKVVLVLQIEIIRPGMRLPSQSVTGRADNPVQMLQIEMFDDRDRCPAPVWWLLCGGFPVCHRYTNWRKSLLYSFPLSPSSSGQGRHPFKVDITGSNPVGGTNSKLFEPAG